MTGIAVISTAAKIMLIQELIADKKLSEDQITQYMMDGDIKIE